MPQIVMGVAICDGNCRNFLCQNMHFNDIYQFNFDKYVVHSAYTNIPDVHYGSSCLVNYIQ